MFVRMSVWVSGLFGRLAQTWRTEVDWDEEITDGVFTEWKEWVFNLKNTEKVKIPRCY